MVFARIGAGSYSDERLSVAGDCDTNNGGFIGASFIGRPNIVLDCEIVDICSAGLHKNVLFGIAGTLSISLN